MLTYNMAMSGLWELCFNRSARESIEAIRSRIQGVQVSAPFGNVVTAIAVIKG